MKKISGLRAADRTGYRGTSAAAWTAKGTSAAAYDLFYFHVLHNRSLYKINRREEWAWEGEGSKNRSLGSYH